MHESPSNLIYFIHHLLWHLLTVRQIPNVFTTTNITLHAKKKNVCLPLMVTKLCQINKVSKNYVFCNKMRGPCHQKKPTLKKSDNLLHIKLCQISNIYIFNLYNFQNFLNIWSLRTMKRIWLQKNPKSQDEKLTGALFIHK